ncbi:hypothetical protein [Saccharibacter floricola]|uniref:Uncharacterized protein n=1 Tax=Saccharibacter floricola DSM 15669 TaxID=1123227 RepID=A0ABQ0P1E9_9PROT|nr:hypothetical protein [Saccharibacter floricola]GBQ08952.1 hypothetical protein AA15669_1981 [Saccharibacter floricola DSM 15669]
MLFDKDFIYFYQNPLLFMKDEGEDFMFALAGWPNGEDDLDWYSKALDSIVRLEISGLITSENKTEDVLNSLAHTTNQTEWMCYLFDLTSTGRNLLKQLHIPDHARDKHYLLPGLREALSRIFDEHGVGFDAELPYKMRLPG